MIAGPGRTRARETWILGAALFVWGAVFIWRTTFAVNGIWYSCLFDDAMISMSYARNLVEGHGFVWARWGVPVEGYTHPIWVALMIIPNALRLPLEWRSLPIQVTSLGFLVVNLFVLEALFRRHFVESTRTSAALALVATAAYYPLNHWSLQGMETAFQAVLLSWGMLETLDLRSGNRGRASLVRLGVIGALATLLRMDLWLPTALFYAFLWPVRKLFSPREWLASLTALIVPNALYLAFRLAYFRDILPNTYYLKMTGTPAAIRVMRGIDVFLDFAQPMSLVFLGAMFAGIVLWRTRAARLVIALVAAQFAYAIYVGGDAWEWSSVGANRFTCVVMPFLFLLIHGAGSRLTAKMKSHRALAGQAMVALVLVVVSNNLASHDWRQHWGNVTLLTRPLHIGKNQKVVDEIAELTKMTRPGVKVAVVWAGIPAFFSDFNMVDVLGYNDRVVAREASARPMSLDNPRRFLPGHTKYDYEYSFGTLCPDVVYQTWDLDENGERALLTRLGYQRHEKFWFRTATLSQTLLK